MPTQKQAACALQAKLAHLLQREVLVYLMECLAFRGKVWAGLRRRANCEVAVSQLVHWCVEFLMLGLPLSSSSCCLVADD